MRNVYSCSRSTNQVKRRTGFSKNVCPIIAIKPHAPSTLYDSEIISDGNHSSIVGNEIIVIAIAVKHDVVVAAGADAVCVGNCTDENAMS